MAAHWCKSTVESVAPAINAIPPPPPPPSRMRPFGQNPNSPINSVANPQMTAGVAPVMSQYEQCYAQLYTTPTPTYSQIVQAQTGYMGQYPGMGTQYNGITVQQVPIAANTVSPAASAQATPSIPAIPKKPKASRFQSADSPAASTAQVPTTTGNSKPAAKGGKPNTAWPPNLKIFIEKCFASCQTDEERKQTSDILQKRIAKISAEGRLSVHKWELEPTCLVPRQLPAPVTITTTGVVSSGHTPAANAAPVIGSGVVSESDDHNNKKRKNRWDPVPSPPVTTNSLGSTSTVSNGRTITETSVKKSKGGILENADLLGLSAKELAMREKRMNRFKDDEPAEDNYFNNAFKDTSRTVVGNGRKKKMKGIATSAAAAAAATAASRHHFQLDQSNNALSEFDMDNLRIVGVCQKVEKEYFRLTSAPAPTSVRPENVLKQALNLFKKKWQAGTIEYIPMCSQLKSIRQDLTVQHIQNEFTVHVYETHARVALETEDLNEYNQCQTQLKQLYCKGFVGSEAEFAAYRILYYTYLLGNKKYEKGGSDISFLMMELSKRKDLSRNPAIVHALKVRQAVQTSNYHAFFQLYGLTPNMGSCILDLMMDNWRLQALQKICKVYKPSVEVQFVIDELAFESREVGMVFLVKSRCLLSADKTEINTKDTVVDMSVVFNEENLLL